MIFAFHGYPALIHSLIYKRGNHSDFHVHGFMEEGSTTTPFDMVVRNRLDRFHLAGDAIANVTRLSRDAGYFEQEITGKLTEHAHFVRQHGRDMPEIDEWRWPSAH